MNRIRSISSAILLCWSTSACDGELSGFSAVDMASPDAQVTIVLDAGAAPRSPDSGERTSNPNHSEGNLPDPGSIDAGFETDAGAALDARSIPDAEAAPDANRPDRPDSGVQPPPPPPPVCLTTDVAPWQEYMDEDVFCFGRDLDEDRDEFDFAQIPSRGSSHWRPRNRLRVDFDDPSTIPNHFCDGAHTGGVFSYFQTFITIPSSAANARFTLTFDRLDDAVQVKIWNTRHPNGYTQDNWHAFDSGAQMDLSWHLVAGENRLVLTHIDDNPTRRALENVRLLVDGSVAHQCP